jgi:5-formyltetrahydrofolate cyclo-ligase
VTATWKSELRDQLRRARRLRDEASDDEERAKRSRNVARAVLSQPEVDRCLSSRPAPAVALYASLPREPPTDTLRRKLRIRGHPVLLPVALPNGRLGWVRDLGGDATAWGVASADRALTAPPTVGFGAALLLAEQVAVVVVPALAATANGERLGQGGGYYDRLLADLPDVTAGGPLRLCLVGPDELVDQLPTQAHDAPVNVVVTA